MIKKEIDMSQLKKHSVLILALILAVSCGIPTIQTKAEYRLNPDSAYKETDGVNNPPEFVEIGGEKYKYQYGIGFDDTEKTRFEEEWVTSCTPRRSTYWLPDMVFLRDGMLNVTTQVRTGNQVEEILKANLTAEEFSEVTKPDKTPTKFGGDKKAAVSGAVEKKEKDLYGLFVARIRMKKDSTGHWNAFWFWGVDPKDESLAYEFDIFEYPKTNNKYDTTTHWPHGNLRTSATKEHTVPSVNKWNTYALLWTGTTVAYYCNWELLCYFTAKGGPDELLNSVKRESIERNHEIISPIPMNMIFSNEVGGLDFAWAGYPEIDKLEKSYDNMQIDWYAHYTTDGLKKAAGQAGVVYGDYPVK